MQLKIGKRSYTLSYPDTMEPALVRGRIRYADKTIQVALRTGQPRRKRSALGLQHTLWHEITHGILHDMNSSKFKDEHFVDELAKRIVQVNAQLYRT